MFEFFLLISDSVLRRVNALQPEWSQPGHLVLCFARQCYLGHCFTFPAQSRSRWLKPHRNHEIGNSQFSGSIFYHCLDAHLTFSTLISTPLRAPEISPHGSVPPMPPWEGFVEVILHGGHGQVVIASASGVNLKHLNSVSVKKSTP